MAVHFLTSASTALLKQFDDRIQQKEPAGKITTWVKSEDGKYYTHKAEEWNSKAWFKPVLKSDRLSFNIIKPKNQTVKVVVYGYYHGHLIETFLNHFDDAFSSATASARPENEDIVGD